MKVIFPLALLSILYACTGTPVTSYSFDGEEYHSWIQLDKDTLKGIVLSISVLNDQLIGNASIYGKLIELPFYKEVKLTIDGGIADTMYSELSHATGSFRKYFSGASLSSIMPEIMATKDLGKSEEFYLSLHQPYRNFPDPLPKRLTLRFHIVTADTVVSGELSFVKVITETAPVLRWH